MHGTIPTHEQLALGPSMFRALPSFRIHLLAGMSARHAEIRFLKRFGIRLLEARILGLLGAFNALSLKEICRESDIEKSHASRLIARLQERGLVEKTEGDKDLRSICVCLSSAGLVMHRALYAESQERNAIWLSVLTEQEQQQMLACVEKLVDRTRTMLEADAAGTDAPLAKAVEPSVSALVGLDRDLAQQLYQALGHSLNMPSENEE